MGSGTASFLKKNNQSKQQKRCRIRREGKNANVLNEEIQNIQVPFRVPATF